MQQVYMYFRGSGKEAEMKRQAARGAIRNAFWWSGLAEWKTNRVVTIGAGVLYIPIHMQCVSESNL